jgi:peptidyl-Asp metalloendopeptidase
VRGSSVVGTIHRGTELYRVRSVGGGVHVVIRIEESAFPDDEPPSHQDRERESALELVPSGAADSTLASRTPVIDVLVAYTPAAETAQGGAASTQALIQLAIDETNQSYRNSRIDAQLRLVRTHKVSYDETTQSYETILSSFSGNGDGFMDEIHTQRDASAADVAVLIVDQGDYCGMADAIMATPATAFALVHWDCATGYYSFGHEIGHLQGARHNPEVDPTSTPFTHGHGFQNGYAWRTIMAYNCSPSCSRLQYWSNPDVLYGGVPMGTVARHNNARVLQTTAPTLSTFRNPSGAIWRHTGTPCSGEHCPGWQRLDNNPSTTAIAANRAALYQLHSDGRIWRYTGTPCTGNYCPGWQLLDNNPRTRGIEAAGAALYQVHVN